MGISSFQIMPPDHSSRVRLYLDNLTENDPDVFLISQDGEQIGTHKIVLRLFSKFLSSIFSHSEQVSHISVPASGSVLHHFVNTITTGVTITKNKKEVNVIAEVAAVLGLDYVDWQVGSQRKSANDTFEKIRKDLLKGFNLDDKAESSDGFIFENEPDRDLDCKDAAVKVEVLPDDDLNISVNSNSERFDCEICSKPFTFKSNLRKHVKMFHQDSVKSESEPKVDRIDCSMCSKSFTTKKYFRKHVREIHEERVEKEKKIPCNVCEKVHGYNVKDDKHYDCEECGKKYYGKELIQKHRNEKHGIRLIPAKIVEEYVADNPNHCHDCKTACKSETDLIYHQDTKHVKENLDVLTCRFCMREINRKQKRFFLEHLRKHTGESPEICSFCGNTFKQKKALKNHERLHTGEKPYKCEFCFTAFTQRSGLTAHQKTKSGCYSKFN